MSSQKLKYVFLIVLFLGLFIPSVSAETIVSDLCNDVDPFDYTKLMECQIDSYLSTSNRVLSDQVDQISDEIISSTTGEILDVSESAKYFALFSYVFVGLLVLITALTGYSYIMNSDNPTKRNEAKRTFTFIIISGVIVILLPIAIVETYNASTALNLAVKSQSRLSGGDDIFNMPSFVDSDGDGIEQSADRFSKLYSNAPLFVKAGRAYTISMNARHLLVLLLISLAPMILLGFIYSPTKEYGKLLAYLFVLELFYPVVSIIVLHFSLVMSGDEVNMVIVSSALILAVVFHIILILATIFKASVTVVNQIRYQGEE
jgi:hypothetical protein